MDVIWLSNEIFNSEARCEAGFVMPQELWLRSYEIWRRAEDLIEKNESAFDLCDGIANLKRSLNHRLLLIEDIYHFKSISFPNKPKGYLELLEYYGIVRPFIMKNLLEIRNSIEHNDADPPNISRCKELLDIVWYFLKSTDEIVKIKRANTSFQLYNNDEIDTDYWFSIDLDYDSHETFKISGWFPEEMIRYSKCENFFCVNAKNFNGKEIFTDLHKDKLETDRWVNGKVNVSHAINYPQIVRSVLTAT